MATAAVMQQRLRKDARQSLPPLSAKDRELAAQAVYPSEEVYRLSQTWRYRSQLTEFLVQPGSFNALMQSGIDVSALYKKLKVEPWQPVNSGSSQWTKAQHPQCAVPDARPCADFGLGFPPLLASSPSLPGTMQMGCSYAAPAPPLPWEQAPAMALPWENANGSLPVWRPLDLDDATALGGVQAKTIEEATALAATWDGGTPPTPPPPPPEGFKGIFYGHCRPLLPPTGIPPCQALEFFIGSEVDDSMDGRSSAGSCAREDSNPG